MTLPDLIAWRRRPEIEQAVTDYVEIERETFAFAASSARRLVIAALTEILQTVTDPVERRRAAQSLLRAINPPSPRSPGQRSAVAERSAEGCRADRGDEGSCAPGDPSAPSPSAESSFSPTPLSSSGFSSSIPSKSASTPAADASPFSSNLRVPPPAPRPPRSLSSAPDPDDHLASLLAPDGSIDPAKFSAFADQIDCELDAEDAQGLDEEGDQDDNENALRHPDRNEGAAIATAAGNSTGRAHHRAFADRALSSALVPAPAGANTG